MYKKIEKSERVILILILIIIIERIRMGLKTFGKESKKGIEKLKSSMVSRSKMKLWMIRATTSVLLWTCFVQLSALGEMWGPRVLKGWPSCFSQDSLAALDVKFAQPLPARVLPPKSEFLFTLSYNRFIFVCCRLFDCRCCLCLMLLKYDSHLVST